MYRRLLLGYAPDRRGADVLALARKLASAPSVEEVVVLEVLHGSAFRSSSTDARRHRAEDQLHALEAGWADGVKVTTRATSGGSPAEALAATADEVEADLVVIGSSHRGFAGRILAGTTAGTMFPTARWPVAIAPSGYAEGAASLRTLGVAYDGSKQAATALRWGVALASAFAAQVTVIGVVPPPTPPVETWSAGELDTVDAPYAMQSAIEASEGQRASMQQQLAAACETVHEPDADIVLVTGDPRRELRRAADDVDMLVVGSHGEGRVTGALLGSVSRGLAHSCPVPLVVVPAS